MRTGESAPLGASMRRNGVDFSVYSRRALSVELLLFDRVDDHRLAGWQEQQDNL